MGIFDFFKKEKNNNIDDKFKNMTEYDARMSNGMHVMVNRIERERNVTYRDGQTTSIMKARLKEYRDGDCIIFDTFEYIAFEIPEGMQIDKRMMECIIQNYYKQYNDRNENSYSYLGRIFENQDGYTMGPKSNAVNNYIEEHMNSSIKREKEERMSRMNQRQEEIRKREVQQFRQNVDARDYLKEKEQEKNKRLQNPTIQLIDNVIADGKTFENYDGINLNTGEILRLRNMLKVGKDENGTYLYTGHIYNTQNKDDEEVLNVDGQMIGSYVCFELPRRLSDIVNDNNKEEQLRLLELLSNEKNYENEKRLKYIGKVDINNFITRNELASSNSIQRKIEELKNMQEIEIENGKFRD